MRSLCDLVTEILTACGDQSKPAVHAGAVVEPFPRVTLDRVDGFLAGGNLRPAQLSLVRGRERTGAKDYIERWHYPGVSQYRAETLNYDRVMEAFREGHTFVFHACDEWLPELGLATNALRDTLRHPVIAVMFITPGAEKGLDVHTDPHDIFAFQLHGTKEWTVYSRGPGTVTTRFGTREDAGAPILCATLEPGDVLYLPRGLPHEARALSTSMHITIGVRTLTVRDVLASRLQQGHQGLTALDEPVPYAFNPGAEALTALEPGLSALAKDLAARSWSDVLAALADPPMPVFLPGALAAAGDATGQSTPKLSAAGGKI